MLFRDLPLAEREEKLAEIEAALESALLELSLLSAQRMGTLTDLVEYVAVEHGWRVGEVAVALSRLRSRHLLPDEAPSPKEPAAEYSISPFTEETQSLFAILEALKGVFSEKRFERFEVSWHSVLDTRGPNFTFTKKGDGSVLWVAPEERMGNRTWVALEFPTSDAVPGSGTVCRTAQDVERCVRAFLEEG